MQSPTRTPVVLSDYDSGVRPAVAYWDLLLAAALAVTAAAAVASGLSFLPLRIPLGLLLAVAVPGYALTAALFPREDDIALAGRLGLAVGLSVAVVPPLALVLAYTPLLIRPASMAGALAALTVAACLIGAFQRYRLRDARPFVLPLGALPRPAGKSPLAVYGAGALVAVALLYAIAFSGDPVPYTAFSVTGATGRVQDLPATATAGSDVLVRVVVDNREGGEREYTVRALVGGSAVKELPLALEDGEAADVQLAIPVALAGSNQRVDLHLISGDSPQPSRTLHFFINVLAQ
jgi:uncharacterized membrane protein